jgi:hypothetical protein
MSRSGEACLTDSTQKLDRWPEAMLASGSHNEKY